MMEAKITVYGAPWCLDCARSKQFLGEQRVLDNWWTLVRTRPDASTSRTPTMVSRSSRQSFFSRMVRFWLNQAMLSWLRSWESTRRLPNLSTI